MLEKQGCKQFDPSFPLRSNTRTRNASQNASIQCATTIGRHTFVVSNNAKQRAEGRQRRNEEVLAGIQRRNPQYRLPAELDPRTPRSGFAVESAGRISNRAFLVETIVRDERPVLFVTKDWVTSEDADLTGPEAQQLFGLLSAHVAVLKPFIPLVGRVNVVNFPGNDFVGTGWFVDADVVVTNRHVAELIARHDGRRYVFARGVGGSPMTASLGTAFEFDDAFGNPARDFEITEILYIEPPNGPNDVAFLRVTRKANGERPFKIAIAKQDAAVDVAVVTVGYPARAPRSVIPDQKRMEELYRGRYDVKRAAPGFTMAAEEGNARHDCTTLGGNSGSVVFDIKSGEAVGLHFAGLYEEANYAVRASTLNEYVTRKRWNLPVVVAGGEQSPPQPVVSAPLSVQVPGSMTIPFSITITVGAPVVGGAPGSANGNGAAGAGHPVDIASAEAAAKSFWRSNQPGVIAVRVGFDAVADRIGDTPHIAASILPSEIGAAASLPSQWEGVPVRYYQATVDEQIGGRLVTEAAGQIAYDDEARKGKNFSFAEIRDEEMDILAHVGPEYSWSVLKKFLAEDGGDLVSAIYEFHGDHIRSALEERLVAGAGLTLVLDNATFHGEGFDAEAVFNDWQARFEQRFNHITVPEGQGGLIQNAYHIKVTVRDDDRLWLSSGNWKQSSSQPIITDEQLENATTEDLEGNREWHVVVGSTELSKRFRSHIDQDLKRSRDLRNEAPGARELLVEVVVPLGTEAVVLERRPPSHVIPPKRFTGKIRVKPLLTPDKSGAIYCDAVLKLIRSAKESLLFQIPYIGMPANPTQSRGYIDDLIGALTEKLKSLPDARVLLRAGGSGLSSPAHAAWYFKSKGVDIDNRVRRIEDHHTKGMIVDGKSVLIGSHNWSQAGVTLNRDASLIFDHAGLAQYYAEAFEVDWDRANPIAPKEHVRREAAAREATTTAVARVSLSTILTDEFFS